MTPEDPHTEPERAMDMEPDMNTDMDIDRDPLLRALSALPREDIDAWRSQRLRAQAHAQLAGGRGRASLERAAGMLELLLMAACAVLGLGRLATLLVLIFSQ
jgi:hypothetical protein